MQVIINVQIVNKNIYKWMIMTFKEIMEDVFKNAIKVKNNK